MRARRVALGLAANIFDKGVIALVQLVSVPVFALGWGLSVYGGWVLLSTMPSFLAVSDFGFAGAAGVRMIMLAERGERDQTVVVFQSAWAVVLLSSAMMIALAVSAAWIVPDRVLPSTAGFSPHDARLTLTLLLLYGIVSLQGTIFLAGLRCAGHFAAGQLCAALAIAAENGTAILVVWAGGRPVHAAAALLACRCASLLAEAGLMRRLIPWLRIGFREARRDEIRSLVAPAVAILAIPIGQASFLQGTALALGIAASQAAVPAFTATRTLSRIGLQMTQLLNHALNVEFSGAVARQDRRGQATMLALTFVAALVVVVPFALVLMLAGPELVRIWTHGAIHASRPLVTVMAVTVVLGGFWNPLSNFILAVNRHAGFAYPYLLLAVATMPATYLLAHWFGATGAAISIALMDAAMCIVILRLGRRLFVSRGEVADATRALAATVLARLRRGRVREAGL